MAIRTTERFALAEGVLDGVSGYLVPEKDVQALADKILLLLSTPERWANMGFAGRKHVEVYFRRENQVEKLEAVYDRLLGLGEKRRQGVQRND